MFKPKGGKLETTHQDHTPLGIGQNVFNVFFGHNELNIINIEIVQLGISNA